MGSFSPVLSVFLLVHVLVPEASAISFAFNNQCRETIYPGVLTSAGRPAFPTTGFALEPGKDVSYTDAVPAGWSGRIWARRSCSTDASGHFLCASGDCGTGKVECNGAGGAPPSTLVEFTFNGQDGKDFYDISNVDGFNVPLQIVPTNCPAVTCAADINAACPQDLTVTAADGSRIGCKSACGAFNTDEYCCRGAYGGPGTCKPSTYSLLFKQNCPQAYSYAYDDASSTFTCPSGSNYKIVFCP
ncbi:hypothetical protein QOZ80_7AG0564320 [Eleusine coracana subsp. coracana]|nr:hypothetical protein QOZ80_7AG0564320 [Eleusine coracana subsp. coracana]